MKKPSVQKFAEALATTGGNLTQTAKIFGVTRTSVHGWINHDPEFKAAVEDSRGKMLDECIVVSRIVALGIPEKDADGKIIGWAERPDPSMLRYMLSTLGRNEGFGEKVELKTETTIKGSIPISEWVKDRIKKK